MVPSLFDRLLHSGGVSAGRNLHKFGRGIGGDLCRWVDGFNSDFDRVGASAAGHIGYCEFKGHDGSRE